MSRSHLDDLPTVSEKYPNGAPYEEQKRARVAAAAIGECAVAGQRLAAALADYADLHGSPTQVALAQSLRDYQAECEAALAPTRL